jgi:hypothetical protein
VPNHYYTSKDDIIQATTELGFGWSDNIYAGDGDDIVYLGDGVIFVSEPGNDKIIGTGRSQYATWIAEQSVEINLIEGWAEDGFGYLDQLSGVGTVHLSKVGGKFTGSGNDEQAFVFGGNWQIDMGDGQDVLIMYLLNSSDFRIRQFGEAIEISGDGTNIVARGVEVIKFDDVNLSPVYSPLEKLIHKYDIFSFTDEEISPGWWYADVYYPPQVVTYFAQAVEPIDIDYDGDLDVIVPLNRGYRTGVDTRTNFLVFENTEGFLNYNEQLTSMSPFVSGSRRSDILFLQRTQSEVFVTVAHDTAVEGENRFDIPWRFGDVTMTSVNPFSDITETLITDVQTYASKTTGRSTAVDAHSMAIGDYNNDGMDDVLVGDWSEVFVLLQTSSGPFQRDSNQFLRSLNNWIDPTISDPKTGGLLDVAMGDLNSDGLDDLVAGWSNTNAPSRVFFNDINGFSIENSVGLPTSVYGNANNLHLKTWILDINNDSHNDLLVLNSRAEPYYGGNYIQILINDGNGLFTDQTVARMGDPLLFQGTFSGRLQWTDFWQVIDINFDGYMDIVSHYPGNIPFYFLNDGTGHFTKYEISASDGGVPIIWADFKDDYVLETVVFSSNSFSVYDVRNFEPPTFARAYDLKGNAGIVAKVIGAVAGPKYLSNKEYVGIGLHLLDNGMEYSDLAAFALQAFGLDSHDDIVTTLWSNVIGSPPSIDEKAPFLKMLEDGLSSGELARLASETDENANNIGLVGLMQNGLDFLPVV